MHDLFLVLIGGVAGIVTGLIGASGVMVVVPGLVALGYAASDAIGASLFIDAIASLVVAFTYYRHGNISLRQGAWLAVGSVVGAQIGSLISPYVPDVGLGRAFSVLLVFSAVMFWFRGVRPGVGDLPGQGSGQATRGHGLLQVLRANTVASGLILGFLVGVISGLLGAGGGVMILLLLVFVLGYSLHKGIGTSTLIMAFTAGSGAIGHAFSSNLPLKPALWGALGTLVGGQVAARFANRVNAKILSRVVSLVFVGLAVMMVMVQ